MDNIYTQKVISANNVFDKRFLDPRNLYLNHFNTLPSMNIIGRIDGEKAFKAFNEQFRDLILDVHQYKWFKNRRSKYQFDRTILVLKNNCLVEFDCNSCEIFHDGDQEVFINELTTLASRFRERNKRQPLEINLIVESSGFLDLKPMEIKRTRLDLDLFYEDDFRKVDDVIRTRLSQKKDKGIVLLHGLPGTGKTTYLRHLIGRLKKRVLFLSPRLAGSLMNPEFLEMLIDNPDTILVIEDAEDIIMDRQHKPGSSVSSLLNISDGLLADFLNIQIICTFNSSLTLIDSALLRKGRLIARYEFGKLSVAKARRLSRHLGLDGSYIDKPMTIAEIANPHEVTQKSPHMEIVGFRRHWGEVVPGVIQPA